MGLRLTINGVAREFDRLASPATVALVVAELGLKSDRIAVEHNGEIAARDRWASAAVESGDRLEIVHFVGGGAS
jgi:sulfur carrier protein